MKILYCATIDFQTSSARLKGTLSGSANVNFNADYALSDVTRGYGFSFRDIGIGDGKTLDIGATPLQADSITGGTISAVLTDAAKTTPIITAKAKNVTIKLEMGTASTTKTTLYHITEGSGFKFDDYLTSRYAVSKGYFDPANASKIGALTNWDGGDLYILRLSAASMVKDMEVHPVIEDALKILDLDDKDLDKLTDKQQDALNKIDDLLTKFDGDTEKKYQVMREIAPDLSKFGILIDENHAKNVINVVSTRFNMPSAPRFAGYRRMYGRSGGDYEAGNGAVWAQGLYNHAEQRGKRAFHPIRQGLRRVWKPIFPMISKSDWGIPMLRHPLTRTDPMSMLTRTRDLCTPSISPNGSTRTFLRVLVVLPTTTRPKSRNWKANTRPTRSARKSRSAMPLPCCCPPNSPCASSTRIKRLTPMLWGLSWKTKTVPPQPLSSDSSCQNGIV